MDKLKMTSRDNVQANIEKIRQLFPNAVTEVLRDGVPTLAIDFDVLKQELSKDLVDEKEERYQFTWPDKKKSILLANSSTHSTLRPIMAESVNFENTKNLYIEGDNLDVLKLLQETYLGKVDIIYIDPPYNTGKNLIYRNNFYESADEYLQRSGQIDEDENILVSNLVTNGRYHTDWLNMIYPRLKVAKDLLAEDGVIIVTIDDYEIENLTKIMNEVFGDENHMGTIVIKNNPSGRSTVTGVSISHEYALFYRKSILGKLGRLPRNEKQIARYKESDEHGQFEWVNFRKHGGYKEDAPTMYYPIYIKKDGGSFRIPKLRYDDKACEYEILESINNDEFVSWPIDENGRPRRWKWSLERALRDTADMSVRKDKEGNFAVYIKSRMKDEGMLPLTVWDDKRYSSTEYGTNLLASLLGATYFDYPKSLYAVMDCIKVATTKPNSLIMDFFSGSATTAHAIMELNAEDGDNRQFILVQFPEKCDVGGEAQKAGYNTICDIGLERIRRAGKKIQKESGMFAANFDVGFRVFKLDSSNMQDVYYKPEEYQQSILDMLTDNIKPDRTPLDLLFQVMLELGKPLSAKIEEKTIAGKKVFVVDDNDLIACFDSDVSEQTVKAIAQLKPLYAVFRDSSLASDSVAVNFDQIFATYSPNTTRKVL